MGLDTGPHPRPLDAQDGGGASFGKSRYVASLTSGCYRIWALNIEALGANWATVIAPWALQRNTPVTHVRVHVIAHICENVL